MDARRRHVLLFLVGLNLLAAAGAAQLYVSMRGGPTSAATVHLLVYAPDDAPIANTTVDLPAGENTVLEALLGGATEAGLTVGLREYPGLGTMVVEIGGYAMDSDCGWVYYVNSEFGTVAADLRRLRTGDVVRWAWSC